MTMMRFQSLYNDRVQSDNSEPTNCNEDGRKAYQLSYSLTKGAGAQWHINLFDIIVYNYSFFFETVYIYIVKYKCFTALLSCTMRRFHKMLYVIGSSLLYLNKNQTLIVSLSVSVLGGALKMLVINPRAAAL